MADSQHYHSHGPPFLIWNSLNKNIFKSSGKDFFSANRKCYWNKTMRSVPMENLFMISNIWWILLWACKQGLQCYGEHCIYSLPVVNFYCFQRRQKRAQKLYFTSGQKIFVGTTMEKSINRSLGPKYNTYFIIIIKFHKHIYVWHLQYLHGAKTTATITDVLS